MKVVLFCGGLGTRLREHSETIPKPLVNVGIRPIIWHLMRYYAHFGHKDFILCLGYRGDLIREYFLNYSECLSNDFVLSEGGKRVEPLKRDIEDWRITFVDTGMHANLGQRLRRVRPYLEGEEMFLANYSDGLCDLRLDSYIEDFQRRDAVAGVVAVRPSQSLHALRVDDDGMVNAIESVAQSDYWINGGFFCLRSGIFDVLHEGEELVEQPFQRLIQQRRLWTHRHPGFWAAMDTFKDKITFDRMEASGNCPWKLWKRLQGARRAARPQVVSEPA
jgi:glucose-1-phosphate cytidylyltransferase